MGERSEYSLSSMNTPGSVLRFSLRGGSLLRILSSSCFIYLYSGGAPQYIRSDNGPEFTVKAVRRWLNDQKVNTLFIERGSPLENGYVETFNGKLGDEFLNREIFTTLLEANILIEEWRKEYNQVRPHSALDYRPPLPETIVSLTLT